jgi:hypothetical protein
MINTSSFLYEETYGHTSMANCGKLNIGGIYCSIIFVSSLVLNTYVFVVYFKNKLLHKATNLYLFVLIVSNMIGTITILPFWIISNIECK